MSGKSGYKVTEIGEIPEEWKTERLDRLVKLEKGKKPEQLHNEQRAETLPYLVAESLRTGVSHKWVTPDDDVILVDKNDVVLIWDGSYSGDVFRGISGVLASTMVKIEPKFENVDKKFLYYFLKTKFRVLNSTATGTAVPHVSKITFDTLNVPLPPVSEQQKIASILSTLDESIQRTDQIIVKTQLLKKGLMQQLLTKGIGHTKFKQTEIGEVSEGWKVVALENIVASYKNGIYKRPEFYGRGVPSVRMYNIGDGKVNPDGAPLLEVTDEELEQYGLIPGDIVVNMVNSIDLVGKAGIVPEGMGPATFESKNIRVRLLRDMCIPQFLAYFMSADLWFRQIRSVIKPAIAQATINQEDLNRVLVCIPSLSEQQKIISILSSIDHKISGVKRRNQQLQQMKKGLMQVLLTGKVRVKVN